jgi:hypothetical protein
MLKWLRELLSADGQLSTMRTISLLGALSSIWSWNYALIYSINNHSCQEWYGWITVAIIGILVTGKAVQLYGEKRET